MYICEKFVLSVANRNLWRDKTDTYAHIRAYLITKIRIVCGITILFNHFFNLPIEEFMNALNKKAVRQMVRAEIAKLSEDAKRALSDSIFDAVYRLNEVQSASTIALFVSLADEPQSANIIAKLSPSKRIVVPRIEGDEMEFYDISAGLERGAFNIMEPIATTPIEPSEIDVMVVPGVAFTRNGARCGRGKGFYDKYISRRGFRAYTIGVCYPCQVVEALPSEPHDKVIDEVIYE